MPHYINKMPQCHNSFMTALCVATNCHKIATTDFILNTLIISIARIATIATNKKGSCASTITFSATYIHIVNKKALAGSHLPGFRSN